MVLLYSGIDNNTTKIKTIVFRSFNWRF